MQSAAARPEAEALETLQELNRGYVRAAQNSDTGWYERHLDPGYMASNPDGSLVDRAGFLARIARPQANTDMEAREVHIRLVGELGIIQSGFRCRTAQGQWRDGCYTDVWSRRSGAWLCISAHFVMF